MTAGKSESWAHNRLEETIAKINTREAEIRGDDRFQAEPATIQVNAPLALIQVTLETELATLQRIRRQLLGEPTA